MSRNQENNRWVGPSLLAGGIGLVIWKSLSPNTKEKIWGFLDAVAEEHQRTKELTASQAQPVLPEFGEIGWSEAFKDVPVPLESDTKSELATPLLSIPELNFEWPKPGETPPAGALLANPNRKWLDVVVHPSVVVILGRRGGGKSALGYRLLELNRFRSKPYVVGLPQHGTKNLPDWLGSVPTLDDLPRDSMALIDEAYLTYHARTSMSEQNRSVSQILNLSRQRNQTLIFITQEARQLDKNITSVADVVIFKKPSALQIELERSELRQIARRAHEAFSGLKNSPAKWSYVFSPDADFEGLLENRLPSFWTPRLSTAFASGEEAIESTHPKPVSRNGKRDHAKELRAAGFSLSAIAQDIGVSKSTVVNYLKDYPYKRK